MRASGNRLLGQNLQAEKAKVIVRQGYPGASQHLEEEYHSLLGVMLTYRLWMANGNFIPAKLRN